jgi:superfamily II DNA/RNA helicase
MALRKNPDILVGTPGRILDLISRDWLNFKNVSAVCVD